MKDDFIDKIEDEILAKVYGEKIEQIEKGEGKMYEVESMKEIFELLDTKKEGESK